MWQCIKEVEVSGYNGDLSFSKGFTMLSIPSIGTITSISFMATVANFMGPSPTLSLVADTAGGPPEEYTWTRDGAEISDGGSFSISIRVNTDVTQENPASADNMAAWRECRYRSTLVVTGFQPGPYQYSANNRAMNTPLRTNPITIEGNVFHHAGITYICCALNEQVVVQFLVYQPLKLPLLGVYGSLGLHHPLLLPEGTS